MPKFAGTEVNQHSGNLKGLITCKQTKNGTKMTHFSFASIMAPNIHKSSKIFLLAISSTWHHRYTKMAAHIHKNPAGHFIEHLRGRREHTTTGKSRERLAASMGIRAGRRRQRGREMLTRRWTRRRWRKLAWGGRAWRRSQPCSRNRAQRRTWKATATRVEADGEESGRRR